MAETAGQTKKRKWQAARPKQEPSITLRVRPRDGVDAEAQNNLTQIAPDGATTEDDLVARCHAATTLMRNWTHHQFSTTASFLSDPLYPQVFDSVWICFAYAQSALP